MKQTVLGLLVAGLCVSTAEVAFAQSGMGQPWQDRVYVNFNFGFEPTTTELSDTRTFTVYEENGTISSNIGFDADSIIDIGAGVRVWRNLSAGIGYHMQSSTGDGDVSGSIPHPLFFDRPRTFSEALDGVDRDEYATHLILGWTLPIGEKLDVMVSGGPSFFRLSQEVVAGVSVAETGPPFTTVVVQPDIQLRKASVTGVNVGADVTYILVAQGRTRIGVGGFFRYSGATATLELSPGTTVDTKVGGPQFGVGLRVRF